VGRRGGRGQDGHNERCPQIKTDDSLCQARINAEPDMLTDGTVRLAQSRVLMSEMRERSRYEIDVVNAIRDVEGQDWPSSVTDVPGCSYFAARTCWRASSTQLRWSTLTLCLAASRIITTSARAVALSHAT